MEKPRYRENSGRGLSFSASCHTSNAPYRPRGANRTIYIMDQAAYLRGQDRPGQSGLPPLPDDGARAGLRPLPVPIPASAPAPRHQRVDGHARICFSRAGIHDLYQRAPCRMLFPDTEAGEAPLAVMITTSGGLTGGDRIRLDISALPGARGTVTTQAAEKLYRVLPDEADIHIETRIEVAEDAAIEWLSQEAIIFDRSRLRRSLDIRLTGNARLLGVEMMMMGRDAMGEIFSTGLIHDAWRIRRDGRLIWADALHIERKGDESPSPFGMGNARALATLVYAGPDAASHLDLARSLAPAPDGGATLINDILIIRLMNKDGMALRAAASTALSALRTATLGAPSRLPALWTI